jgi:serine/threonine-protein kinase
LPVFIDGEQRGITPLTLALSPGQHRLAVHGQGGEREVPLTIAAGADVTQYFDLQAVAPGDPGQVSIVTEPPGARATVNGRDFGITPVTVGNLAEGTHRVRVTNADATVERTVTVTAGGRTSAVFTLAQPSGPVGGYLTIATPFDVQVLEGGAVIGSSGVARIMIPSGRHDLVLTNRSLGYSERKTIEIQAGQLVALRVEPPMAPVSINARPWADVFVDGTGVGQTPIANIRLPLGSHRIMFRHPQLGDRMQTAIVTANEPNRFAVDFSK